jgi:choline dehydrogenase-like flavoprotein
MSRQTKGEDHATHDVIVVGAGITGCWAAKELAEAGLKVCLLDAGPSVLAPAHGAADWTERGRRAAAQRQPVQSQHPAYWLQDPTHFVDDFEHPYSVASDNGFNWIRGRQVGGRSLTWGGVALRFSDYELRAAQTDGYGPAWPLTYQDLQPYYEQVERYHGVQGECDGLTTLPDGVYQPVPELTPLEERFKREVMSRWADRPVVHCRAIAAQGSAGATVSPRTMLYRTLPDALRTGRVTLRENSVVARVISDPRRDRVVGVECVDRLDYTRTRLRGRLVILCASTIESVRILLNSATDRYPTGLANSSGLLGHCLMDHAAAWGLGYVPDVAAWRDQPRPGGQGLLVPRFRNVTQTSERFIRGYGLWANIGTQAWGATEDPMWALCAMLEVLPRESNYIELDPEVTDPWGIPTAKVQLTYSANELHMLEDAEESIRQTAAALGWPLERTGRMVPGTFAHELGGARMGRDPATSVLNPYNQSWDLRNLFVLDGACFVTSGWQNPTLTMMALTARACEFIAQEHAQGHL